MINLKIEKIILIDLFFLVALLIDIIRKNPTKTMTIVSTLRIVFFIINLEISHLIAFYIIVVSSTLC